MHQKGTISVVRGEPLYRENKKRFKDWMGSKVSVDAGLEELKVISCWEDGRRKRVPVSRCHRNKRIGECVRSIGIQFNFG